MKASEMSQQVRALATEPDNLSSIPRTHPHGERREPTDLCVSSPPEKKLVLKKIKVDEIENSRDNPSVQ